MSDQGDDHIRSRAYELWEKEGRPDGRDLDHWEQAERELTTSDDAGQSGEPEQIDGQAGEVSIVGGAVPPGGMTGDAAQGTSRRTTRPRTPGKTS